MSDVMITRFTKSDGPLTKRISLSEDGKLKSDGSGCLMVRGTAERVQINDVSALAALISDLDSEQAIALGALRTDLLDQVKVVTKRKLNGHAAGDVIARTADSIQYRAGQSGFALLDFDTKGMPADVTARLKGVGSYWAALCHVLPELRSAARVTRRSTSSGLVRTDTGEKLPGSNGLHVYVAVKDSADIERFLRTLHDRCWLAGYGWLMVGAGGQLLERSIVDRMVGAPERLVFEGKAIIEPPLEQNAQSRNPIIMDGTVTDTLAICPPLSVLEKAKLQELKAKSEHELAGESAKVRTEFIDKQSERISRRIGMSRSAASKIVAAQCRGVLLPNIELPFDEPELAGKTVADVLADPAGFEGATLADPLEGIEYGTCKAKIMRRADGTPWVHSFAHGRTIYEIKLDAVAVRAAIDRAAKDDVMSTFARLATVQASVDAVELGELIEHVSRYAGVGKRDIARVLKEEKKERAKEQAQAERNRRMAERKDPRPEVSAPDNDAPWIPEMKLYNDVLSESPDSIPPIRDIGGDAARIKKVEITDTHAFTNSKREEEVP
jgi:hypothetical protein